MAKDTTREEKSAGTDLESSESRQPGLAEGPASEDRAFPVVGLGASAGGLEALSTFFSQITPGSNMSYIALVHQSPDQPSMMPELLQKVTSVPVDKARDGDQIQPDRVYVIPPHKEVSFYNSRIQLLDPVDKNLYLPVDFFFRSLAADKKNQAVGVILSGTGTDGTVGLKDIKSHEGLVLVQSESTAKYDGMPRSAINTGQADMILAPEEMPEKLRQYFEYRTSMVQQESPREQDWIHKIFALLRVRFGHDFSEYKENTLLRRINRRMGLNQIQDHEVYLRFLRENPQEQKSLFQEMLIGVTNFFREPQSFEVLKQDVLPHVLHDLQEGSALRAWIPGCSTGEEAYSLAMVIVECMEQMSKRVDLKIFGTDIDEEAVDKARHGLFPGSIKADVSQERLNRFFSKEGESYRVRKEIRECVVFSVQDVLRDPPFSSLNLLCCRNLLIYLNSGAQHRLLPLFHYTLAKDGILMLGSSETIGGFTNVFDTLNSTWKIYKRKEVSPPLRQQIQFPTGKPVEASAGKNGKAQPREQDIKTLATRAILEHFSLPCVLVESNGDILYTQGRTGKYLEPASGLPRQNILDMAREGLNIELSAAIRSARNTKEKIVRNNLQVKDNGGVKTINLYVTPLQSPLELQERLLVAFEDVPQPVETEPYSREFEVIPEDQHEAKIRELEEELQRTKDSYQTVVEELESTNEELQSSNEELQSTNEELVSSKEELQSLNEELHTVNAELQSKVDELTSTQEDMSHLLNSTEIAMVFVDNQLRIKRFSREATRIINMIDTDVGRPLEHQVTKLEDKNIIQDLKYVLDTLIPVEEEVRTTDGVWYIMRIMPYRSMDNKIQGCVLTFRNIQQQKEYQAELQRLNAVLEDAWSLLRNIFDMNDQPMAVLDSTGSLVLANTVLCRLMGISQESVQDRDIHSFVSEVPEQINLESMLESALQDGVDFETDTFRMIDEDEGERNMSIKGRVIHSEQDSPYRILISFENKDDVCHKNGD